MPIVPPRLDDRSFEDLVEEVLARIPAHTPEWTHARVGDPGRTLLELFAWLTDTILYRANLIPERQRLVFLRLLGMQMRPATAATGVVGLRMDTKNPGLEPSVVLRPLAEVKGPVAFETRTELTVVDVSAEAYFKRPLTTTERKEMAEWLPGLAQVYGVQPGKENFYVTTPVFASGAAEPRGFDLVSSTIDRCLWIALFARKKSLVEPLRTELEEGSKGAPRILSVGVAPATIIPALFEDIGERARIPHVWEISGPVDANGTPTYQRLTVAYDSTKGLTRRGVVQLVMPGSGIDAPTNDVKQSAKAGTGDRPPRLDDVDRQERLVAWLRLRPTERLSRLELSWVDIHAVEIDQRKTHAPVVIGQSNGSADQVMRLPATSVESESLQIQVEEPGQGYQVWRAIDDLAFAGRDEAAFQLDSEAGTIRFGDGIRGRIPGSGMRVRVASMRSGGGASGNLPPGLLKEINAKTIEGAKPACKLKVVQSLPTLGGQDQETLVDAERRIPALLRHGERAVTADDFRVLAAQTPGTQIGRVEVLSRFKPQQRRDDVPGVVSVMVLPQSMTYRAPNPRPDRPTLEAVHAHLDARRTLGSELYVIGCEYVPIGVGAGITVKEGFGRETVANAVRETIYRFLWPLSPGGPAGTGWPLGRSVRDREIEVAVAQVPGVETITGVRLFAAGTITKRGASTSEGGTVTKFDIRPLPIGQLERPTAIKYVAPLARWAPLSSTVMGTPLEIALEPWQLPELMGVAVDTDGSIPTSLLVVTDPFAGEGGIAIPVVPEVC